MNFHVRLNGGCLEHLEVMLTFYYSQLFSSFLYAGIYKIALSHKKLGITKEMLATKIVPFLFPLCIDNGLNLTQVRKEPDITHT
jgi:hypothetical protein